MATIVKPKRKSKVFGPFHLTIKYDVAPDQDSIAIYSLPYKSGAKPTLLRQVGVSKSIMVDFLPRGCHELFIAFYKDEKIQYSNRIIVMNQGTPAVAQFEGCPCGSGKKLGDCGCGGHKKPSKDSSSEEELVGEEKPSDHSSSEEESHCDTCHRPLKDCGCGGHKSSSSSEEEPQCDSCHRNLKDCGCGKKPKHHPRDNAGWEMTCGGCGKALSGCGCGKKPKHDPPKESLEASKQESLGGSQIVVVHRSVQLKAIFNEVVVAHDSSSGVEITLPQWDQDRPYQSIAVTNFSAHEVTINPGSEFKIATYDGKWGKVDLVTGTSVSLIPSTPGLWYLRQ